MEWGLFIRTKKGPGGPGPNEFMIQWAGIAAAQSPETPSSMPPSFLSIFIRIRIILRIRYSSGLEERDHVLLTVNFTGSNGNCCLATIVPITLPSIPFFISKPLLNKNKLCVMLPQTSSTASPHKFYPPAFCQPFPRFLANCTVIMIQSRHSDKKRAAVQMLCTAATKNLI